MNVAGGRRRHRRPGDGVAARALRPRVPRPAAQPAARPPADILEALLAEGATEMRFGDGVPPEIEFTHESDDDLVMIACRRTTFECVPRRAALAEANVTIRRSLAAIGLIASPSGASPGDSGARAITVLQTKDQRRLEPSRGPATRAEFLDALPA